MNWHSATCLGAFLSYWATAIGVVVAIFVALYAARTYRSNNSIKKWELIGKTYDIFLKDDWYYFYKRIQDGVKINFDDPFEEKLLNETLTLFDALNYFQTQKLLDKRAWEYVACEIQNFALNNSVCEYMERIKEKYTIKGFHQDIIPFTGFPELLRKVPKKFKVRIPPELEKRLNALMPAKQNPFCRATRWIYEIKR